MRKTNFPQIGDIHTIFRKSISSGRLACNVLKHSKKLIGFEQLHRSADLSIFLLKYKKLLILFYAWIVYPVCTTGMGVSCTLEDMDAVSRASDIKSLEHRVAVLKRHSDFWYDKFIFIEDKVEN